MDLIELRQALRRGWVVGLVVALVTAIGGTWALGPAESRFAASSTLLVTPRPERFQTISTGVLRVVLPNVLVHARSESLERSAQDDVGDLGDRPVEVAASYVRDSAVLTLTTRSPSGSAAIAWNRAIADELVALYDDDPYLLVEILDPATTARIPGVLERNVDMMGVGLLSVMASVFAVFLLQRLRESGDLVGRVRAGGLAVLAELAVPTRRRSRPVFKANEQVRRLALALTSAPAVPSDARFLVVSGDTRPALAVVDAMRSGLEQVGMAERHRVVLGPSIDDLPGLHRESRGGAVCVAVLDPAQRVDSFIRDVHSIHDAEIPVAGVVVLRRRP